MALLSFVTFIATFIGAIITFQAGAPIPLGIFFLILSISSLTCVGVYLATNNK